MRRRLPNLLTGLSLLMCVAVAVLWVRSYRGSPAFEWGESHASPFGWRLYDHRLAASDGVVYWVRSYPPLVSLGTGVPPPGQYEFRRFGFLLTRGTHGLVPSSDLAVDRRVVGVPLWSLALAASVLPAARFARRLRRHPPGLCPACGYDLRATPGRCPECGTTR